MQTGLRLSSNERAAFVPWRACDKQHAAAPAADSRRCCRDCRQYGPVLQQLERCQLTRRQCGQQPAQLPQSSCPRQLQLQCEEGISALAHQLDVH